MAGRETIAVLVLVSLVVLSGCATPFGDSAGEPETPDADEPSPSTEDDESEDGESAEPTGDEGNEGEEETDGAESSDDGSRPEAETTDEADEILPVDVYETYDRVRAMFGSDAEMPRVEVSNLNEELEDVYEARQDPFQDALNMTETEIDTENARGLAWSDENRIVVDPNEATDADIEQTLVHEYAHSIQFSDGWYPQPRLDGETATSTDYRIVETALVEGSAVWVTDRYSREYQADDVRLQSERLAREYETAPDGDRYFRAPYHYGNRYVDRRIDDPTDLERVYEAPPVTSEQLVHDFDPDEERPTDLDVRPSAAEHWTVQRNDRLGELFVRVALETELDGERAADAAEGWGNDRLVGFHDGDEWGFVWVTHWDAAEDADEFEAAFEGTLDERTDADAGATTVDRHDDRTVIVTVGSDAFRDGVTVTGSDADVDVSVTARS